MRNRLNEKLPVLQKFTGFAKNDRFHEKFTDLCDKLSIIPGIVSNRTKFKLFIKKPYKAGTTVTITQVIETAIIKGSAFGSATLKILITEINIARILWIIINRIFGRVFVRNEAETWQTVSSSEVILSVFILVTCAKKLEIFTGASSCSSSSKENVSSSENSELFDEFLDIWCFGVVLFLNRFRNDEKLVLLLLFVELELSKSLDVSVSRLVDDFSPEIARKELKM